MSKQMYTFQKYWKEQSNLAAKVSVAFLGASDETTFMKLL